MIKYVSIPCQTPLMSHRKAVQGPYLLTTIQLKFKEYKSSITHRSIHMRHWGFGVWEINTNKPYSIPTRCGKT